jgi:hypothetical protein
LIGADEEAAVFFAMVDAIEQNTIRLDEASLDQLAEIKSSWAREPYERVLEHIETTYLRE